MIELDTILSVLGKPIYIFKKRQLSYFCDKLESETDELGRNYKRYVVTESSCTCMSFMKTGKCKHIKMLKGDFSFSKFVISFDLAKEFIKKVSSAVSTHMKEEDYWQSPALELDDEDSQYQSLTFRFSCPLKDKSLYKIVSVSKGKPCLELIPKIK